MATLVDAVAEVFTFEALSGTTSSFTQGSSDRYIFGGAGWVGFGPLPDVNALKYGGSGGTDITPGSADVSFFFGNAALTSGSAIPGPSGTSTIYGAASAGLQGMAVGAAWEGVDSADDYTTNSGAQGDTNSTVVSVVVPNCVENQWVEGWFIAVSGNVTIAAFTDDVDTTDIVDQDLDPGVTFSAVCYVRKQATADGSCTLQVRAHSTSAAGTDAIAWAGAAERLIDAAGGGGDSTITAASGAATASSMAGSSTASTTASGASGAATASTMAGSGLAVASFTPAAGAATASSASGSSTATGSTTQASGAATASTAAGSSTAVASITGASGAATAATMSSDAGAASITPADGQATAGALAGSSVVVASFVPAAGLASSEAMVAPRAATGGGGGKKRKRIFTINGLRFVGTQEEFDRLTKKTFEDARVEEEIEPPAIPMPLVAVDDGQAFERAAAKLDEALAGSMKKIEAAQNQRQDDEDLELLLMVEMGTR